MNALLDMIFARKRLVTVLVTLFTLLGLYAWGAMPRQEDPTFLPRFAALIVPFPGADAEQVERLIVARIEEELTAVEELRKVESTARAGVAVFTLELNETVYETQPAWDKVRIALDKAAPMLPPEAGTMRLDETVGDPASVVVMLTGNEDLLALREGARVVQEGLRKLPGALSATLVGDPGARIAVRIDPNLGMRLGLDARRLAAQLSAQNVTVPAGQLEADGRLIVLRPRGELADVAALRQTPILLPDGAALPLGELAEVTLEPLDPPSSRVRFDGAPAVAVQLVPERPLDMVRFGQRVREALAELGPELSPLQVEIFAFQPDEVESRLSDLSRSLLSGVFIVAAVLFFAMGPRLGGVVSSVVPLVALTTIGLYAMGGGVLHQISIAALVLALGLLVDNAIVVAEAVQQHLDAGLSPQQAAREAVRELLVPLGSATGTTVAAFLPMLLASGGTADFTRSIPIVVITTLVLSYVFAVAVTPQLSAYFLRPNAADQRNRLADLGAWLGRSAARHPFSVLAALALVFLGALGLGTQVNGQFFPLADRPRYVISVELPEGSRLERTEALATELTKQLAALPSTASTAAFIGRGSPRFYYNLNNVPEAPHAASLVITTHRTDQVPDSLAFATALAAAHPEARIVARRLQQGPPVGAPVEVELRGEDLLALNEAADRVVRALRDLPGTRDVAHDLGLGVPTLELHHDDAAELRRGLGRADVALALLGQTQGVQAGVWRGTWSPVGLTVMGLDGASTSPGTLPALGVSRPGGPQTPLAQLAQIRPKWAPAAIHRKEGERTVTVTAQLDGVEASTVVAALRPILADMDFGPIKLSYGGEAKGSEEANAALLSTMPLGVGTLLFFLLLQFDSIRRVGIILVTVPLAAVGVLPGLALTGQPFGFMSLLGVIALVGVVVNNAIVLLEVVEVRRAEGADVETALSDAVRVRLRPILLTTATTIAGLLPLALSSSSLWPPLAWAMISGLAASTGLTVLAVPALVQLLLGDKRAPALPPAGAAAALLLALSLGTLPAQAASADAPVTMGLEQVLLAADTAPLAAAAQQDAKAARANTTGAWLAATAPTLGGQADVLQRNRAVQLVTPFGNVTQQPEQQATAGATLTQPLLRPSGWLRANAQAQGARAAEAQASSAQQQARQAAASAWLDLATVQAGLEAAQAYQQAMQAVSASAQQRAQAGLDVPTDTLRAEVALANAAQQVRTLQAQQRVAAQALGARLGLDHPVYADFAPLTGAEALPDGPDALQAAREARPDLQAAERAAHAQAAARTAALGAALPSLDAYGNFNWSNSPALAEPTWLEGGLRLSWTPVAGGQRIAAASAASAQRQAALDRRDALSLGIGVELTQASTQLELSQSEVSLRQAAFAQASEASAQLEARYSAGLASLTDLLQVQAEALAQHTRLRQAEVEVQRARIALRFAQGQL